MEYPLITKELVEQFKKEKDLFANHATAVGSKFEISPYKFEDFLIWLQAKKTDELMRTIQVK